MNNHFNHISATDRLKTETLKKAKAKIWIPISAVAAMLIVIFAIPLFMPVFNSNNSNNSNSQPESIDFQNNLTDVSQSNGADDKIKDDCEISEDEYQPFATDAGALLFTETPIKNTPTITPVPTTTPYQSNDGLSAQVTERPKDYDEHIAEMTKTMYVKADILNVLDYASMDAPVKFTLTKGQQVTAIVSNVTSWSYVSYKENGIRRFGFVQVENLSAEKP